MKAWSAVLVLFLVAAVAFAGGSAESSGAANGDNSLSYVKEKGELVLGLDDSFPPMGFRGENGEIVGFDIDLATEVADRMGVKLRLQPIDWDAKVLDLNSKDIDVIWNGLTITDDRKQQITFSKPYIANRQIVIVQAGSAIATKADLDGKVVGLQLGSSAQDAVEAEPEVLASFSKLARYQDNVQALLDLGVGRIDAVVVDEILGRYYIAQKPGMYAVAKEYFAEEEYGVGFRKGDIALRNRVDAILDEMVADGTAKKISVKWFGEDILLPR